MQFISCHDGKLQTLETAGLKTSPDRAFATGLQALDALAPGRAFACGAVHELLFAPRDGEPNFVAALLAKAAAFLPLPPGEGWGEGARGAIKLHPPPHPDPLPKGEGTKRPIIWSDPRSEIYPPALAALGFDLANIYLLRPQTLADENWAIAESLRCKGVAAVIAAPQKLSRIEARRLQLAAERGGTVGILLRQSTGRGPEIYAAATRWLVRPMPGQRTVQRWKIQLLHGHGGRVGQTVILECCRETHTVRALEKLADRPAAEKATA